MNPLHVIDSLLNRITMYRLLLYGLRLLIAIAIIFCFIGVLSFSWWGTLVSAVVLVSVCWTLDQAFSRLYKRPANSESAIITALILTLIMPQITTVNHGLQIAAVGLVAIASKYIIAWRGKQLFNPAAFGAGLFGLLGVVYATWWIGNSYMLPFVVVFGLLLLRKIKRLQMFFIYLMAATAMAVLVAAVNHHAVSNAVASLIKSSPLLFLGTIMLTEPTTAPTHHYYQRLYGVLVGVLSVAQISNLSPQIALLIGNVLAFAVNLRRRIVMKLVRKTKVSPVLYDFAFEPNGAFRFTPGQYLEWTIPITPGRNDMRGNRRTFSIASGPSDALVHIGIKVPAEKASRFKTRLMELEPGDTLAAAQLAGDFCMPKDVSKPLVWIAGGIGITPYVSMARDMISRRQKRSVRLFYSASPQDGFAFKDVFEAAEAVGVSTTFTTDRLTAQQLIQDDAIYYVSGPPPMVNAYRTLLRQNQIPARRIITDTFTGY